MNPIGIISSDEHMRKVYLEGITRAIAIEKAGKEARKEAHQLIKGTPTKELRIMVAAKLEDPNFPILEVLRGAKEAVESYERYKKWLRKES